MLNLTEDQIGLLQHFRAIEIAKKVDVSFEDEKEDTRNIRRIAYLDGGRDMLKYLLDFDAAYTAQKEAEKRALLGNPDSLASGESQPFGNLG